MIKTVMAAVAALSLTATASFAAVDENAARTVVRYGDLNLANPADAKRMDARIRAAARSVCGEEPTNVDLAGQAYFRACVAKAESGAVAQLNAPMVTAAHEGRTAVVTLADARR